MADVIEEAADRILARDAAGYHHEQRDPWTDALTLVAEPEPDREWVIPGFIERQGRILLAGAEGCGKSLMAMTLAVQVASGLPALDTFKASDPRRVLYLDLEMARSSTRRRLRVMANQAKAQGAPLEADSLGLCLRPDGLDLASGRERQMLEERIAAAEPELLIIDPLYKLTLTDSVYERDIKPTLAFLDRLRVRYGVGLILLHHLRKRGQGEGQRGKDSSDIFGSSVLLRWPETTLTMTTENVWIHKDRDETFGNKRSWPITHGPTWPIGLGTATLLATEQVLEYVVAFGPVSGNQLAKELGIRRQAVWDALRELEREGKLRRTGQRGWAVPE